MRVFISPWLLLMLVICGTPIGFGVGMIVGPSGGGLYTGIPMIIGGVWILVVYLRPNVWVVRRGVVRCLRWSVRVADVEWVTVSQGSAADSPNPGWQVVLRRTGDVRDSRAGLACTSQWGAMRQASCRPRVRGASGEGPLSVGAPTWDAVRPSAPRPVA